MALIKCPECGKEISDKAPQCIHCGFPLKTITEKEETSKTDMVRIGGVDYDLTEVYNLVKIGEKIKAIKMLCDQTGIKLGEAKKIVDNLDKNLSSGATMSTIGGLAGMDASLITCKACGKKISNQASTCIHCGQPTGVVVCPKCGSSMTKVISGASKAVSVGLWGIFAANKVMSKYQCKKCGHKF